MQVIQIAKDKQTIDITLNIKKKVSLKQKFSNKIATI